MTEEQSNTPELLIIVNYQNYENINYCRDFTFGTSLLPME
jgi:hypothetical protein